MDHMHRSGFGQLALEVSKSNFQLAPCGTVYHTHPSLPALPPTQKSANHAQPKMRTLALFSLFFALLGLASAQFNIFEQMFGGGGGGGGQQHQQHHQQQQNVPSDSSFYRSQVDRGMVPVEPLPVLACFVRQLLTGLQRTAKTTCVPTPSPASTFPTTVLANGRVTRTSSSWPTGSASVFPRVGSSKARRLERSSWRGRDCCERHLTIRHPKE